MDAWMGSWRTVPKLVIAWNSFVESSDWAWWAWSVNACDNNIHGYELLWMCIGQANVDRISEYRCPSAFYRNQRLWWRTHLTATDTMEICMSLVYESHTSVSLTKCPVSSWAGQQVQYTCSDALVVALLNVPTQRSFLQDYLSIGYSYLGCSEMVWRVKRKSP